MLAAALTWPAAHADITVSGAVSTYPGSSPIGPGDTLLPNQAVDVGSSGVGSFSANGGSLLRAGKLAFGNGGNGDGTGTATGVGTRIELVTDGLSLVNRFEVGNWGIGSFTLSGGATIDGRANASACLGEFHYCNNFIANAAGSTGTFTITGAGSSASFLQSFVVGGVAVFHPPVDAFTFGTPGGTSQGNVNVLAGGKLLVESASLGVGPGGGSPSGTERSFANALISGANSVWTVSGGVLAPGAAGFSTATHPNAWATVNINDGGKLRIEDQPGFTNFINLSSGGRTDFKVSGIGSAVEMSGDAGVLQVGRALGSASFDVLSGATASGLWYFSVGRDGARGVMTVDGAGSKVTVDGTASAAAQGSPFVALADIGRNGTGVVNVTGGGRLEIAASDARANGPTLRLGRDASSSGTLNISGAGSAVTVAAASVAPGTAGEAFNPFVSIGADGSGTLRIDNGGKLLVSGNAVSTVANSRTTSVYIGGRSDTVAGGHGSAAITGAGSELAVSGTDAFLTVGQGPGATGQLELTDRARIASTLLNVGSAGAIGVLRADNASIDLSGQWSGSGQYGAGMTIGHGTDATGVATLTNGTRVTISNSGSGGTHLNLGGSGTRSGGDGSLTLSGGSSIQFNATPGLAAMTIGRDGTGLVRMREGSSIDLGDGSLYVARFRGSDGTLLMSGGSTVSAGYVGVGRNKLEDGGTGTLVVNGSTLTATTIEIGANGYLGGNGTIVGNVVNYGIFNPGNSPGTMVIDGSFMAGTGGRLTLEIESDGLGSFNTDRVVLTEGSSISLDGLAVTFRFLGNTDPIAFLESGAFDIDTFFRQRTPVADVSFTAATFDGVHFAARSDSYTIKDFSFSAAGGAHLTVAAIPEPETWALMFGGLAAVSLVARRRRRGS